MAPVFPSSSRLPSHIICHIATYLSSLLPHYLCCMPFALEW